MRKGKKKTRNEQTEPGVFYLLLERQKKRRRVEG